MTQSHDFQDQSHINQVCEALWERPSSRASVMVGSGFSRNAVKLQSSTDDTPTWRELAAKMARRLYPEDSNAHKASVHDALRLAQEYETGFGRGDLHRFLQQSVRDSDFSADEYHLRLLELPWRDVFTTNWDTLLERAAERIAERSYSVVRDKDEIPLRNQPRVVKLHGSFPAQFPLVFTEEDYRTYPRKFAPFVNTVQQAMMETVFCLVGFSGDDPNFLQWSGWVRDNLGESAPKIYLAGWLNLSVHRRRMLEDRGVVPIDLARHPKADQWPERQRHRYATEWILETLERGEPYDLAGWPSPPKQSKQEIPYHLQPVAVNVSSTPQGRPEPIWTLDNTPIEQVVERVRQCINVWAHNRRLYPGWLVCPADQGIGRETDDWEQPILFALKHLTRIEQLKAVRELTWRREIQLELITEDFEVAASDVLRSIDCDKRTVEGVGEAQEDWPSIRENWVEVALTLLTAARLNCRRALFEQRLQALSPFQNDSPEVKHRIQHEGCLWAVYSLDFESLNGLLDEWQLENSDPAWMLRKAALLTEAGRIDESRQLIQSALLSIRSSQARNPSIANASRETWALASTANWESRGEVFKRWDELAPLKCNVWTEIENIERAIRESGEQRKSPSFELGVIHSEGTRISDVNRRQRNASYRAVRLLEIAGLPPLNNPPTGDYSWPVSMVTGLKLPAAAELVATAPELAIRLVLRFCDYDGDDTLKRVLSRARIAVLPSDSAESIASDCIDLIKYALPRLKQPDGHMLGAWVERMRVALEVLSRLVLRLSPDTAEQAMNVGLDCYGIPEVACHTLLARPASNLLERSWNALPNELRSNRALDLLGAPISGLDGFLVNAEFIDPGRLLSDSDMLNSRTAENGDKLREVVRFIIRGLNETNEETRARATMRLFLIAEAGLLTASESSKVENAIWGSGDPILGRSGAVSHLDWIYFVLPQLKPKQAEQSFRNMWLATSSELQESLPYAGMVVSQVGLAIDASQAHGYSLELSSKEQEHLIGCVSRIADALSEGAWHSQGVGPIDVINGTQVVVARVEMNEEVAEELFRKVESMTGLREISERERFLASFLNVGELRTAFKYAVLPGLVQALPSRINDVVSLIRVGLASDDESETDRAMRALERWLLDSADGSTARISPPNDLVNEIGVIVATRRKAALTSALQSARWVFNNGTQEHRAAIRELTLYGLSFLAEELRYERRYDDETPTLRFLCVQLSVAMAKCGYGNEGTVTSWLEIGRNDPLPEVRKAVEELDVFDQ